MPANDLQADYEPAFPSRDMCGVKFMTLNGIIEALQRRGFMILSVETNPENIVDPENYHMFAPEKGWMSLKVRKRTPLGVPTPYPFYTMFCSCLRDADDCPIEIVPERCWEGFDKQEVWCINDA